MTLHLGHLLEKFKISTNRKFTSVWPLTVCCTRIWLYIFYERWSSTCTFIRLERWPFEDFDYQKKMSIYGWCDSIVMAPVCIISSDYQPPRLSNAEYRPHIVIDAIITHYDTFHIWCCVQRNVISVAFLFLSFFLLPNEHFFIVHVTPNIRYVQILLLFSPSRFNPPISSDQKILHAS